MTLKELWEHPLVMNVIGILIATFIIFIVTEIYKKRKNNGAFKFTFWQRVILSSFFLFILYLFDETIYFKSYQFSVTTIKFLIFIISNNLNTIYWIFGSLLLLGVIYIVITIYNNIQTEKGSNKSFSIEDYKELIAKEKREKLEKKLSFIAAKFGDYIWKWEWIYSSLIDQWEVKRFRPCCPDPDCKDSPLELDLAGKIYTCPICKQGNIIDQSSYDIQKLVEKEVKYRESYKYEIDQKLNEIYSNQRFT